MKKLLALLLLLPALAFGQQGTAFPLTPNKAAITSGTINGTTIGATMPSTGKFTSVDASTKYTFGGWDVISSPSSFVLKLGGPGTGQFRTVEIWANTTGNVATKSATFTDSTATLYGGLTVGTNIGLSASALTNIGGATGGTGRISVTGATSIFTLGSGGYSSPVGLVLVAGAKSTDATVIFTDLVLFIQGGGAPTVISSQELNTPSARTYSVMGADLKLAMTANTYFVNGVLISQGN